MGMARYVVDAVLLEGRGVREVAAAHGISKSWIYELIGRFRAGGYGALEPARTARAPVPTKRRPRSCGGSWSCAGSCRPRDTTPGR